MKSVKRQCAKFESLTAEFQEFIATPASDTIARRVARQRLNAAGQQLCLRRPSNDPASWASLCAIIYSVFGLALDAKPTAAQAGFVVHVLEEFFNGRGAAPRAKPAPRCATAADLPPRTAQLWGTAMLPRYVTTFSMR